MSTSHLDPEPARHFRHVLSHLPTGVVVVTGEDEHGPAGLVVGSFVSISLNPPLAGFFCDRSSTSWPLVKRTGGFCVNVLAHDQQALAATFARRGGSKFDGIEYDPTPHTGSPVLRSVLAWIDCEIEREIELGDHTLIVGSVVGLSAPRAESPLVFFRGAYPGFLPDAQDATEGAVR